MVRGCLETGEVGLTARAPLSQAPSAEAALGLVSVEVAGRVGSEVDLHTALSWQLSPVANWLLGAIF